MRTLLVLVVVGLMAACARKEPARETPAKPLRHIVLQTDWFPQGEHGGFYQALAKGFYTEAGLEVEIWPGGPGSGIKLKVAKGDADFGMQRSDDVILAASRGMPLVMVAATMQHDPMALMVHAASPVQTLRDLEGRVVIGNVGLAYFAFLEKKLGLHFERRQNTYGLGEFLANPDTIQQCMVTNEPFFAAQNGRPVRTLSLADAGYDCYHTLVCRRELVRHEPALVRAFIAASIRGWHDYLESDPGPAHDEILKRNPNMTRALLDFSRGELIRRRIVHGDPAQGEAPGRLSLARIGHEIDELLRLGILDTRVAPADVATEEFVPRE